MAQYPGIPWNQRPDYLALTQRVDPAGLVTTYNPPRPGLSATDVTSFVYGQANITINNWPEVMYYLHPTPEWTAFRRVAKPQQKLDANNQGMVERFPCQGQPARPLLDFPILPDTIYSAEELWWIELWRRMDPRIKWADILMRIELPNRTVTLEKNLQNSTNNLINRHDHKQHFMLAWHATGANSTRANHVRSEVLGRVAAANPPLNFNSTRGLTPGLINPLLGYLPGNSIPFPQLGNDQGRLRVRGGQPRVTQAAAAANQTQGNLAQGSLAQGNPGQGNLGQATAPQNNQRRNSHRLGHRVPSKRPRSSPDHKGGPRKRQARNFDDVMEDDNMDTGSDGDKSSEDVPLSVAEVRAPATKPRKSGKPTFAVGKAKNTAAKKKLHSHKTATAKKTKQSTTYQRLMGAQQVQQDSTTEHDVRDDPEDSDEGDRSAGLILFEGDPGFEAAFMASRRRRRQAQDVGPAPHPGRPPRPAFPNTPPTGQYAVSDSEVSGDTEESTLVESSDVATAPQVPATPAHPANTPTPARRRAINAITRLPFEGARRRPEALSGYGHSPVRRRGSRDRSSRAAPPSLGIAEDDRGHAVVTRESNAARLGLPVAPLNRRPAQSTYRRSPSGSHHYTDDSGAPTYVIHPRPSTTDRIDFTPNQRRHTHAQTNAQPPHPGENAQLTTRNPANAPNGQGNLMANNRTSRLTDEIVRHNNAGIQEMLRRDQWQETEMERHGRAFTEIMRGMNTEWARGFLEREHERERREIQGSSDSE